MVGTPQVAHAYTDLFDLKTIQTKCTPNSNTLLVLDRLQSGGKPIDLPLTGANGLAVLYPHEIVPHYLTDTKVRLFIASFTSGNPNDQAGGVAIVDVDYSSPTACTVSTPRYWPYDADRATPNKQTSDNTDWTHRPTHTAAPFFHTNESNVFVLTTDEIAGTRYNLLEQDVPANAISSSAGRWTGGISPIKYDGTNEDDRRLGGFVRVWDTQTTSGVLDIIGTGTSNGPLSMYDPIESVEPENLYYASRKVVPTSSVTIACTTSTAEEVGPNTVHRVHTISPYNTSMYGRNENDVFVSANAAGCRVINLGATASNGTTLEKGFFDFIPSLNYDKGSDYFYKLNSGAAPSLWPYQVLTNIGMYAMGVWHSVADFGTDRVGINGTSTLPEDEKFIHVMGFGEGKIVDYPTKPYYTLDPPDVQTAGARNWISDGGFMMLRYFDGKLGGTISGYTGTNSWGDRSYRTVNLQGDFSVDRDVTIATGACVNLLPGHSNDPGVFTSTSLASSSGRTIYVDGILNISVTEGDALGTDIVINVPIVVRTGGQLNVYKIASGKKVVFKKPVTVNSNGSWTMHESSNVELFEPGHTSNGKFTIAGTSSGRVTFTGRRAATGVSAQGSLVKGVGTYASPTGYDAEQTTNFSIRYADCSNAYFDMTNMQTAPNVTELKNSKFERTVTLNIKPWLVRVDKHGDYRRFARFYFSGAESCS